MTRPGVATRIINEIVAFAGQLPVVKVDVSRAVVTVTFVTQTQAIKAYSWINGAVIQVDSDVVNIAQSTFDPRDFNVSDVGSLFAQAERLGTSASEPQLQIVEYDPGEILMTVTTRPESATVFFRKDGTPIQRVDFETAAGLKQGMQDALGRRNLAYSVGYRGNAEIAIDLPGPSTGTVLRRIRQEKLPAYSAVRKDTIAWQPFDTALIDFDVISQVRANLRAKYEVSLTTPMSIVIDGRYNRSGPTVTYTFGSRTIVTDLHGVDITAWVLPQ